MQKRELAQMAFDALNDNPLNTAPLQHIEDFINELANQNAKLKADLHTLRTADRTRDIQNLVKEYVYKEQLKSLVSL